VKRAAYFLAAPALCIAIYWRAFFAWFTNDDFPWLALRSQIHSLHDFALALFSPQAQGTVRFLSERLYFIVMYSLFGLYAGPFRAAAFLVWFADLALASLIGTKLTRSRAAGLWAGLLWTSSYALLTPLSWASAFNQLLCALCLLTAFYARIRSLESGTGPRPVRWSVLEWTAYLLGFGALELTVMYPLIATLYTWGVAKHKDRSVIALFVPAAIFAGIHALLIPRGESDIYRAHVDSRLPATFLTYLKWTLGPSPLEDIFGPQWHVRGLAATWMVGLALAAFLLWKLRTGESTALFCVAWFLVFLAPVLPLPNHISDYYVTIPLAGMAWLGGWALVSAWRSGVFARAVAVIIAASFLAASFAEVDAGTRYFLRRSSRLRQLIRAVEQTEARHPGSVLILHGVDNELFQAGFQDNPFRLAGAQRVYMTPGTEVEVIARQDLGGSERFRIAPQDAAELIESGQARALDVSNGVPRDVTKSYLAVMEAVAAGEHRSFVDVGLARYASLLGPGWYDAENGYRWMGRASIVRLAGPEAAGERLYAAGYAAPSALASGPLPIELRVGGALIGSSILRKPDEHFVLDFALPVETVGKKELEISVTVGRTFRPPGDPRDLGIVFGTFEIR